MEFSDSCVRYFWYKQLYLKGFVSSGILPAPFFFFVIIISRHQKQFKLIIPTVESLLFTTLFLEFPERVACLVFLAYNLMAKFSKSNQNWWGKTSLSGSYVFNWVQTHDRVSRNSHFKCQHTNKIKLQSRVVWDSIGNISVEHVNAVRETTAQKRVMNFYKKTSSRFECNACGFPKMHETLITAKCTLYTAAQCAALMSVNSRKTKILLRPCMCERYERKPKIPIL